MSTIALAPETRCSDGSTHSTQQFYDPIEKAIEALQSITQENQDYIFLTTDSMRILVLIIDSFNAQLTALEKNTLTKEALEKLLTLSNLLLICLRKIQSQNRGAYLKAILSNENEALPTNYHQKLTFINAMISMIRGRRVIYEVLRTVKSIMQDSN